MVNYNLRRMYINDPCKTSSIPYWKLLEIKLPANLKVVHETNINQIDLESYHDDKYFRIINKLDNAIDPELPSGYYFLSVDINLHLEIIVDIICRSYTDIKVSKEQVISWTKLKVYNKGLWVILIKNEIPIGLGIADYDHDMKEGILEWIQVLPEHRNKGMGQAIVNELLSRLKDKAEFVTVSGQADNPTQPERLYRKCGFVGNDIWHVLTRKK